MSTGLDELQSAYCANEHCTPDELCAECEQQRMVALNVADSNGE